MKKTDKNNIETLDAGLKALLETVAELRHPERGCPWDREQTHKSLSPYLIEEAHEFLEELEKSGPTDPKSHEELGDLFFQVLIHTQLLSEAKLYSFSSLCEDLKAKIIRRHPHVFDPKGPRFKSASEVNAAWEQLKGRRRAQKAPQQGRAPLSSALKQIPKSLGALQQAQRSAEKAMSYAFRWDSSQEALHKLKEEVAELEQATSSAQKEEELGDLLLVAAQYAQMEGIDAEGALKRSQAKWSHRLSLMEQVLDSSLWKGLSTEEKLKLWQKAKKMQT